MGRFQYSLRSLFCFIAVVAVGACFLTKGIHARRQYNAVQAIRNSGADVWYEFEFSGGCHVADKGTSPRWLIDLCGIDWFSVPTKIQFDARSQDPVSDEVIAYITELPFVESLDFGVRRLSDTQVRKTAAMSSLNTLGISWIEDRSVHDLAHLTSLRELSLRGAKITDSFTDTLLTLVNIETIDLSYTRVTDRGLQTIAKLKKLRQLAIEGTTITGQGLLALKKCKSLRKVIVSDETLSLEAVPGKYAFEIELEVHP